MPYYFEIVFLIFIGEVLLFLRKSKGFPIEMATCLVVIVAFILLTSMAQQKNETVDQNIIKFFFLNGSLILIPIILLLVSIEISIRNFQILGQQISIILISFIGLALSLFIGLYLSCLLGLGCV